MFVGLGVSGVVPVIHGSIIYGFNELDERMGLTWVLLEGALYIFGAFIYAVSVFEKKIKRTERKKPRRHPPPLLSILFLSLSVKFLTYSIGKMAGKDSPKNV